MTESPLPATMSVDSHKIAAVAAQLVGMNAEAATSTRQSASMIYRYLKDRRQRIPEREQVARLIVDSERRVGLCIRRGDEIPRELSKAQLRVCLRFADIRSDDEWESFKASFTEVTSGGLMKVLNRQDKKARVEQIAGQSANALRDRAVFTTIVADPPWSYGNAGTRNAASLMYPTMSLEEICKLGPEVLNPVINPEGAHLYLWTTHVLIRDGFDVLDAWGFTHKATLTWVKQGFGMGNYFRSTTEHVLFGIRGDLPTFTDNTRTHFGGEATGHSVKPDSFFELAERNSPAPRLEMFARKEREGWACWGNEA